MVNFGPKPRSVKERFWSKVRKTDSCWVWCNNTNSAGYGMVFDGVKKRLAHRVSWELARGPIPPGKHILHKCDNSLCVRPAHLFLGTAQDNMRDMHKKGRNRYGIATGTENPSSKLTPEVVEKIKEYYAVGATQKDIAKEFDVAQTTVSRVVTGRTWAAPAYSGFLSSTQAKIMREKYATSAVSQSGLAKEYGVSQTAVSLILRGKTHVDAGGPIAAKRKTTSKLTAKQVEAVRARYAAGEITYRELAEEYGVSKTCICFIVERRNWKDV